MRNRVLSRSAVILAQAAVFVTASACGQVQPPAVGEDTRAAPPAREPSQKSAEEIVHAMGEDLARRLGVKVTEIEVLTVERVVWSDGSLGCPQPGQSYLTAQVPGLRALFQQGGRTYQYHASDRGHFVYCPQPEEPAGRFDRE